MTVQAITHKYNYYTGDDVIRVCHLHHCLCGITPPLHDLWGCVLSLHIVSQDFTLSVSSIVSSPHK